MGHVITKWVVRLSHVCHWQIDKPFIHQIFNLPHPLSPDLPASSSVACIGWISEWHHSLKMMKSQNRRYLVTISTTSIATSQEHPLRISMNERSLLLGKVCKIVVCGWAFGAVSRRYLKSPAFPIEVSGFMFQLHSHFSFLLMCIQQVIVYPFVSLLPTWKTRIEFFGS